MPAISAHLIRTLVLPLLLASSSACAAITPQVAAGRYHNLAVDSDGAVWWWGTDHGRQFDLGETVAPVHPTRVEGLPPARAVAAAMNFSVAVTQDGRVYEWGMALTRSRLVHLLQPSLGPCRALVILSGGHGKDHCGDARRARNRKIYTGVPVQVRGLRDAVAAAASETIALVLDSGGRVHCWSGRSGVRRIDGLDGVVAIAAGGRHALALRADGALWTFGDGAIGRAHPERHDTDTCIDARPQALMDGVAAIAASTDAAWALKRDGSVWEWVRPGSSQTLLPEPGGTNLVTPHRLAVIDGAVQIAGGFNFLAVRTPDRVYAWGVNLSGRLGTGDARLTVPAPLPVKVRPLAGISAGAYHVAGLTPDGAVCAWGEYSYGVVHPGVDSIEGGTPAAVPREPGGARLNLYGRPGDGPDPCKPGPP